MKQWLINKLQGPVYLDCYTLNPQAYNVAQLRPANKFRPEWWDKLPPYVEQQVSGAPQGMVFPANTMKFCAGLQDFYKNSFCLPMWTELLLNIGPEGTDTYTWKFADSQSELSVHPQHQRGRFMDAFRYQHAKLIGPWRIRCSEDVNFLMCDPFWNDGDDPERPIIPPGVVNFKYQIGTNINLFFRRHSTEIKRIALKFNYPLVFLVPLTERKVIIRHHLVGLTEMRKITALSTAFNARYYQGRKFMMDREKEAKCPMKSK